MDRFQGCKVPVSRSIFLFLVVKLFFVPQRSGRCENRCKIVDVKLYIIYAVPKIIVLLTAGDVRARAVESFSSSNPWIM